MKDDNKLELIKTSWELHDQIEKAYLIHPAKQGDSEWLEKQRLLLADMALHLLQTTVSESFLIIITVPQRGQRSKRTSGGGF